MFLELIEGFVCKLLIYVLTLAVECNALIYLNILMFATMKEEFVMGKWYIVIIITESKVDGSASYYTVTTYNQELPYLECWFPKNDWM